MTVRSLQLSDLPWLKERYAAHVGFPADVPESSRRRALDRLFSKEVLLRSVGLVQSIGDEFIGAMIATEVDGEWDFPEKDGIIHTAVLNREQEEACRVPLAAELLVSARQKNWAFLRTRLPLAHCSWLEAEGWQFKSFVVRKLLHRVPPHEISGWANIRAARAEDADTLAALISNSLARGMTESELRRYGSRNIVQHAVRCLRSILQEDAYALVAEIKGEPVGCAIANMGTYNERTGGYETYLHDVYVVDALAYRGIARQLLTTVEETAKDIGVTAMETTVTMPNRVDAERLLCTISAHGWEPVTATYCREVA
jgi:GNAT superfamily N-acetyltransferase